MEAIHRSDDSEFNPIEKLKGLINSELYAMDKYQDLIMIIVQESHAMQKSTLSSLLQSERDHVGHYERIIKEGIEKGFFKPGNIRMLANLVKILIDTWAIKRWDLRGKVTMDEMRKGILDIVFNGIMKSGSAKIS